MKPTRDSGFTLIEVLVAFAILAVTFGAVSGALSTGMTHEIAAERTTTRVLEMRSIFDRIGTDIPLAEGTFEGRLTTGESWSMTVTRLPAYGQIPPFSAYDVVLTVQGDNGSVLSFRSIELGG
ncbi:PulJ/GspJ family protein [Marimonas arenosa]|uniref:Prepilin-type N-terminal cleavage/methylation domain-containing protein n=1 Tax=Marimonas arenosa TaxID=1795305 RepID=A0AAE3WE19_9RHOB|nr:prepilin-type N-terminal cleavage/methylation domain-containing protein [Marimonas arenosa]MDQ2090854.1 prepilin-type N-terminal cleavage/methylation domain-containing protein [Marimonas arenosa]